MAKNKVIGAIVAGVVILCVAGGEYYFATKNSNKTVNPKTAINNTQVNTTKQTADTSKTSTDASKTMNTSSNDAQKNTQTTTTDKTTTTNTSIPVGATINEIVPNGNIIKSAQAYAVPANEVNQMVQGKYPGNQKEVFLTFDDGPSTKTTPEILSILNKYGVHGTFFVLGSELQSQEAKDILKQEILDGNAIADHSYSHSYKILYPHNSVDVNTFMNEFNKTNDIMRSVLGSNFNARIVRMPGGYMSRAYYHDKNLPELNAAFAKQGITSIDWSAESGDAEPQNYSVQQLVQNAEKESKGWNHVVLLMHDIKPKTVTNSL
ncbi:MAG: polysaccharide deacetylase family protein [Sarcina sp.]